MVDAELFAHCCEAALLSNHLQTGIGSLGEKTLHAALKNYYAPNPADQEISIGSYVADIATGAGITEIQTSGFGKMRDKLNLFLTQSSVKIVYPVAYVKWIRWINPDTGELSARHKSPKKNGIYSLFRELYSLGDLIIHPKICFNLALLEVEEIRLQDGFSKNKKRGSHKSNTIPINFLEEIIICKPEDYFQLLPVNLEKIFTAKDLQKLTRLTSKQSFYVLHVLKTLGIITQIGKQGRAFTYQITSISDTKKGAL